MFRVAALPSHALLLLVVQCGASAKVRRMEGAQTSIQLTLTRHHIDELWELYKDTGTR